MLEKSGSLDFLSLNEFIPLSRGIQTIRTLMDYDVIYSWPKTLCDARHSFLPLHKIIICQHESFLNLIFCLFHPRLLSPSVILL